MWPGLPQWIVLAVAALRVAELIHARRNSARLLAAGGQEHGAAHYPLFFVIQGAWLIALVALTPADAAVAWPWLAIFVALQAARLWVIASLGRFWTTRIITLADAPVVDTGPYRWMRHPNYAIVAAEIAVLPLALGQWPIAVAALAPTLALLGHRIRVENTALADRR